VKRCDTGDLAAGKTDARKIEDYAASHPRFFVSRILGVAAFAGLAAMMIFFIALRGEEQTLVPDVRNMDLINALLELQVKDLYPRIQLRYSQTADDRGLVLEQDPLPGTIVKAGRRIRLVVSQGLIMNTMENYRGRNIDDARMEIRALFASLPQPLITFKEPFMYEYSSEPAGSILRQRPPPGTPISSPTALELVISRGVRDSQITVPALRGLSTGEALRALRSGKFDFSFSLRPQRDAEKAETVVEQEPEAGAVIPAGQTVFLVAAAPARPSGGSVFGLFTYLLPENPYPLPVRLEALLKNGERRVLAELEYGGGKLTIPYRAPVGATLIFSLLNRELHREEALPAVETLPFD
jgi:beta-lactam-binding protein with PASTA domain